ncbi:MAG: GAF domain-containing protein, partial [Oceanospirillum sp.]|nr:GAF domain-containing protein [Oceanospirillum sp.]
GPFQGPVACTRIPTGKGVCGAVFEQRKTLIVPNVDEFPGHIACASESKSEIVLPIFHRGGVAWVLDIDSDELDSFDDVDQHWLEKLTAVISLML